MLRKLKQHTAIAYHQAMVVVCDTIDDGLMAVFNRLPEGAQYGPVYNFLINTSLDLAGAAANHDGMVYFHRAAILDDERLALDIQLGKAHQAYLDVVEGDCTDYEEMLADDVFDDYLDLYEIAVNDIHARQDALNVRYGFNIHY